MATLWRAVLKVVHVPQRMPTEFDDGTRGPHNLFTLECGHVTKRYESNRKPKRLKCHKCIYGVSKL
jgi:hypothetical protein